MPDVTFRDYAFAVMQKQLDTAHAHLQTLLALGPDEARVATEFFQQRTTDPAFLPKAMQLRTAVESGTDAEIGDILVHCFGLDDAQRSKAVAAVRVRYPKPS